MECTVPLAQAGAELYDPGTSVWMATGAMTDAREGQTATPLSSNLVIDQTTVGGNVQVTGGGFTIGPSSAITGNLQIQNVPDGTAQNQVCGTTVTGNLQLQNSGTAVQIGSASPACAGNVINGNLEVQNNTGSTGIVGNTVGGNLQDQNNTGSTQVFYNTVTQNLQCQNNSSITGGGNTARQKQGQCAAF